MSILVLVTHSISSTVLGWMIKEYEFQEVKFSGELSLRLATTGAYTFHTVFKDELTLCPYIGSLCLKIFLVLNCTLSYSNIDTLAFL